MPAGAGAMSAGSADGVPAAAAAECFAGGGRLNVSVFGGGRPGGGGGRGFLAGATTNRRYNVTIAIEVRNLLNSVNPGQPIGILGSPQFGQAQDITNGFFGRSSNQSSNRRLEMQLRFSF